MDYVRANAASIEVVNLSLGGYIGYDMGGCAATAYHQAFCNVVNAGVTVVVAAGNDHSDARDYVPAQFDEVITVSAFYDSDGLPGGSGGSEWVGDYDDEFASFSNWGADVDIAAPGVGILSTASQYAIYHYCEDASYCYSSGTSMASPHVAGGAALVLAQQGRMSPCQRQGAPANDRSARWPPDGTRTASRSQSSTSPISARARSLRRAAPKSGDSIQVRVGDFTPTTRALFRFNGTYIGGDTIDDAGRGYRNYTIPNMPAGTYQATVSNGLKTVTKNVKIVSSISVNRTSAPVGETVTVTLRGFGKGETVTIKFGSKTMGTKTVSSSGYGQFSFMVPTTTGGNYARDGKRTHEQRLGQLEGRRQRLVAIWLAGAGIDRLRFVSRFQIGRGHSVSLRLAVRADNQHAHGDRVHIRKRR